MTRIIIFHILLLFLLNAQAYPQPEAVSFYQEGVEYLENEDYVKAIGSFTKAISLDDSYADAYFQRAIAKKKLSEKVGYKNTELCNDLIKASELGKDEANLELKNSCTSQCFDINMAFYEPEIVFCADFSSQVLHNLPEKSAQLHSIVKLTLFNNKLTSIPRSFASMNALLELDLSSNRLVMVSSTIGKLKHLEYLNLNKNMIQTMPEELNNLAGLKELYLRSNDFNDFPIQVISCENLEVLDLSLNNIQVIPAEIAQMKNLKKINLVGNPLSKKSLKILSSALPNTTIYTD